MYGAIFEM